MSVGLGLHLERGHIERDGNRVTITLPASRRLSGQYGIVAISVAILAQALWSFGFQNVNTGVLIAFGTLAAVVAMAGVYFLLWSRKGREVIQVDARTMRYERRLMGRASHRVTYALSGISDLHVDSSRASDSNVRPDDGARDRDSVRNGPVAFRYDNVTHRFGAGLTSGDATIVVAHIIAAAGRPLDQIDMKSVPAPARGAATGQRAEPDSASGRSIAARTASSRGSSSPEDAGEARVIERGGGILIEVPPARVPIFIWSTGILMVVSLAGLIVFPFIALTGDTDPQTGYLIASLGGIFLYASYGFVVTMWRRETVAVDEKRIVLERKVLGYRSRRELEIVPEARLWLDTDYSKSPEVVSMGRRYTLMPLSLNRGPIVYQGAGGWRYCFGDGLTVTEAAHLVSRIHAKSPSLIN